MGPEPPDSARHLEVVWSQDELHRRTRVQRLLTRHGPRLLRLSAVAVLFAFVCLVVGVALAEQALRPVRRLPRPDATAVARVLAVRERAGLLEVPLVAADGVLLRAWSFERLGPSRGTVLLLHGLSDNRASQLPLADLFLSNNYRVLAPDARAHGTSGGEVATYGLLERVDLRAWASFVREQHPDECVFAAGTSMGAAIVLQTVAVEPFCAVIAEAPYATFRGAALQRVSRQFGLPPMLGRFVVWPFVDAGLLYARLRHGYRFGLANPEDGVARSRVPVLLIEDGSDDQIPAGDAARIAAANPRHVSVWTVPGARHVQAWAAAPREYPTRVLAFLSAHQ